MKEHSFFSSWPIILLFLCTKVIAESPAPAPAPAPVPTARGPTNVIKILKKASQFKVFIRLLKTTQLDSNLNSQLGNTNNGLTIFAPSDIAFSNLKAGTLSSLTLQQKVELVQFHIVPTFISTSQFDTVTNPLKTHAGSGSRFQLNVTKDGNSVNITTGLTNTTISDSVYSDSHLAIYQVDKVLLPIDIFTPKPPAPAPATVIDEESPGNDVPIRNTSGSSASIFLNHGCNTLFVGVGLIAALMFSL
ncbi:hypothetical protein K2173_023731 [Erythroxylum novogranatense]|uniref:FAS1 domain-containing protein n=1 Tax=Erythroxylum novogranatense TaxID=1862640 RepID=A0AAV8TPL2_9ROSI|nr:hypothetical protein K2173_023731 [Erythroxylum novogranatense]